MVAGSSEGSMNLAIPVSVIRMEVVIIGSNDSNTLNCLPKLTVWAWLILFERDQIQKEETILEALFLEKSRETLFSKE